MRRDRRLEIITDTIERLIPGAVPSRITVRVAEDMPRGENTWTGSADGLAVKVFTALFGRPRTADDRSPLARAEDAKRGRDLIGELEALTTGHVDLTTAPWYPLQPGDLVHVHYEQTGELPTFGETYIVGDASGGLLSMQLLAHSLPADYESSLVETVTGWFGSEASDDPIYDAWFEGGPQRLTVVRHGRAVHVGGAQ